MRKNWSFFSYVTHASLFKLLRIFSLWDAMGREKRNETSKMENVFQWNGNSYPSFIYT